MLILCGTAAAVAVVVLALIIGYTLLQGISYVNVDFFIHAITPVGETGGGMRNELIGSAILVGLGTITALPIGLMAGIYLSEFGNRGTTSVVRFVADILAGVPSIIIGIFAYALLVKPLHSYSAIQRP
jgi:phosphate transport system permease protein